METSCKIRAAVRKNDFSSLLELVFIPLYGKVTAAERSKLALEVLKFEREQLQAGNMDIKFLAATLVMTNKILNKEKLKEFWEVIKMLDVIELAIEKGKKEGLEEGEEKGKKEGLEEGEEKGLEKGRMETAQEMILDTIYDLSGNLQIDIIEKVKSISHFEILKRIHRQALKCKNIEQFQDILNGVA